MEQEEKIDLLWDRFIHQKDTYAKQLKRNRGDEGEVWQFLRCLDTSTRQPVPLTKRDLFLHMDGSQTLGVYQLLDDTVKWVCFDIDISKGTPNTIDVWELVDLQEAQLRYRLDDLKIPYLMEFSGNRGVHIWVFFTEPVPAIKAKAFGEFVLSEVDEIEGMHIELFPKQATTNSKQGNLVKLPLGVHRKSDKRSYIYDDDDTDQWKILANTRAMTPKGLDNFINHFDIALEKFKPRSEKTDAGRGLPCYTNILEQGVEEGSRDLLTFSLAVFLKNHGIPEASVTALMTDWNQRNKPPLYSSILQEKIDSAMNSDYSHFVCMKEEIEPYCESTCYFYANKMKNKKKVRGKRQQDD